MSTSREESSGAGAADYGAAQRSDAPSGDGSAAAGVRLFTAAELASSVGDAPVLRLSILGSVFDVTKGRKHYGTGASYAFFAGRDGSRAFVTGQGILRLMMGGGGPPPLGCYQLGHMVESVLFVKPNNIHLTLYLINT